MRDPLPPPRAPDPGFGERFQTALRRFDAENAQDPNLERLEGRLHPREWLYAQRLTGWVFKLCPQPSEPLQLAARCQHLCRWMIPRAGFDPDRAGYLRWRNRLKSFHAEKAGTILAETGYPPETIAQVQALVLKANFPADPDSQILEDALCLLFLEHQLSDLAAKTSEEKLINALRKSWNKMSPQARALALQLPFCEQERKLVETALAEDRT